jgi:hypothetical protein
MSKKLILILVALGTLLLTGGFLIFQQIQEAQKREAYNASSDKIADDFIHAVKSKDVRLAMSNFSSDMLANYSEDYWKTTIFAELQDFNGTPKLRSKGAVQPASAEVPNRYDPRLNQQATEYLYEFPNVNGAAYELSIVVFRQNGDWKINEVNGGYRP